MKKIMIINLELSKNQQDIRQSHSIHHRSHENVKSRIDSELKNFSRDENPERYLLGI